MYEYIIKVLESGHWIGVKNKDGDWKVFTYVRPDGELEGMEAKASIEDSLNTGQNSYSYTKEDIENYFTNEYQIVPRIPKPYKAGDLVDILDTPEAREYVIGSGQKLIGKKGVTVIGGINANISVKKEGMSGWYVFPHCAVVPHFKEESKLNLTDEELIKELKKETLL